MKREVYILAAALLFLTGCSSQKKESPSVHLKQVSQQR